MLLEQKTDLGYDHRPVLLVVRVEFHHDKVYRLKERLNWLADNIFPFPHYQKRCLILLTSSIPFLAKKTDRLYDWALYEAYNDVYTKIMNRSYLVRLRDKDQYFQCAIYLNIRDDGKIGMAWGLREGYHERCILRAMFLQAKGNVLFGDWGWAGSTPPDYDPVALKRQLSIPDYWYARKGFRVMRDTEEHRHVNVPFTRILNHFLRPQYATDETLSEENMNRIKLLIEDKLFDEPARTRALWSAHRDLLFPQDFHDLDYHRWHTNLRLVQVIIIEAYVRLRMWIASSTWFESAVDLAILGMWSIVFATVSFGIQNIKYFIQFVPIAPLAFQPLRFVGWYLLHFMVYFEQYPPQDRPTFRERFMETRRVALVASAFEPFTVLVASRMTWISATLSLLIASVHYFAISQMDWTVHLRHPKANRYTILLDAMASMLVFGQQALDAAPRLLEFHALWFPLMLLIGLHLDKRNFLHLYELTMLFHISFLSAPLLCAVILCSMKFLYSYL